MPNDNGVNLVVEEPVPTSKVDTLNEFRSRFVSSFFELFSGIFFVSRDFLAIL